MKKDKNKKKTLTISGSFNKKFDSTSYDQSGKKSFSVDRKKIFKTSFKSNKLSKNLNKNSYLVISSQNFFFTFVSFNQIAANYLKKVTNLKNKKFLKLNKYFTKTKTNNEYNVNKYFSPKHNNIEILNALCLPDHFKGKNYGINYIYSDYYNYHSKFLRTNKKDFTSQKNKWKKIFFSSAALHFFSKKK